jgi:hypothetical protein
MDAKSREGNLDCIQLGRRCILQPFSIAGRECYVKIGIERDHDTSDAAIIACAHGMRMRGMQLMRLPVRDLEPIILFHGFPPTRSKARPDS